MPTKKWYQSKVIWLGIITTTIGVLTFVHDNQGIDLTLMAAGILQVILRTVTTSKIV